MTEPAAGHAQADLRRWQKRIFANVWLAYFTFYLCRQNMPVANKRISDTFGWDKEGDFGKVLTALLICYAIGQFVNGQLGDRFGTRRISSIGIFGSVAMNMSVFLVIFFISPSEANSTLLLTLLVLFWGANGFFQSMGWAPMVRAMAHWFPVSSRGATMGWLGTCYMFGGAVASIMAAFFSGEFFAGRGGDWRMVFLVPSSIFAIVGVIFIVGIRNTPPDVGLPPVDSGAPSGSPAESTGRRTLLQNIRATVSNPFIWIVAATFFLLDLNRYGFVNWMPKYLDVTATVESPLMTDFKKMMKLAIHPLAGAAGVVVAGWATDRFFRGRRAPVIAVLMAGLGICTFVFSQIDPNNTALIVTVVALVGFFTYGSHILMVGHAPQDFGSKEGAAGAAGFIDGMGYIGASLAGWGAGVMIDAYGFERTFMTFGAAALLGAGIICIIWKVGPNPKGRNEPAPEEAADS